MKLFDSLLFLLNILYSTDYSQSYMYTYVSDDDYYVDSDDYEDFGYYYDDDDSDEDWFY